MNNLTDEQIIKALEYCCGDTMDDDDECTKDKCYQVGLPEDREGGLRWCRQWLMKDALDLINRQKAEIEELKHSLDVLFTAKEQLSEMVGTLTSERDTLLKECKKCGRKTQRKISKLQKQNLELLDMCAEQGEKAIKEFAERLKEKSWIGMWESVEHVDVDDIDNLVKEMVGDDNA